MLEIKTLSFAARLSLPGTPRPGAIGGTIGIFSIIIAGLLALVACGKEKAGPGAASGSGSAAVGSRSSTGEGSVPSPSTKLPNRKAPPTAEALAKLDAACDGGTGPACFEAGMRRAAGMGTARDRVAAVAWTEKGCKLDDAKSCGLLAMFIGLGAEGVPANKKRAFELYQKACPRDPASCTILATYYGRGEVVPRDEAKAMAMLEQGCAAGDGDGCEDLANRLANGNSIAKDEARGAAMARKACDLDPRFCETLGAFYIAGTGVAKDSARGQSFVEKACNGGSKKACKGLQTLRGS